MRSALGEFFSIELQACIFRVGERHALEMIELTVSA
jgi:hypothetical protein